jgi:hypothetical protein
LAENRARRPKSRCIFGARIKLRRGRWWLSLDDLVTDSASKTCPESWN